MKARHFFRRFGKWVTYPVGPFHKIGVPKIREGTGVNDRAVSVLENYELEVIRTQKGRNAILFETGQGWMILKEYRGPAARLEVLEKLLAAVEENGFMRAEKLIRNKDGALVCTDLDQTAYIVKTWPGGRECS